MASATDVDWAAQRAALKRLVAKRVSDHDDVNDIAQDVLVRAHEALHQLVDAGRLPAWLGRIAEHRVLDHFRIRRVFTELPQDLAAPEPEDDPVVTPASCLPSMIERLPDVFRDALRLPELDGVAKRDVARRLGVSLSGAKSRIQRGRERLRELVEARLSCRHDGLEDQRLRAPRSAANLRCADPLRRSASFRRPGHRPRHETFTRRT